MEVVVICKVLGHKKIMKMETKQREDVISVELAHHQTSDKELCGALQSSLQNMRTYCGDVIFHSSSAAAL